MLWQEEGAPQGEPPVTVAQGEQAEAIPSEEHISALTTTMRDWLDPITTQPWAQAGLVLAAFLVLAKIVDLIFRGIFRVMTRKAEGKDKVADERLLRLLRGPLQLSVVLIGIGVGLRLLEFSVSANLLTLRALLTVALFSWASATFRATGLLLRAASRNPNRFKAIQDPTFPLFNNLAKLMLFGLFLYLAIQVWGWDATGWLASAGVAGLALGFAAQDTLSNLFAGVFILADRPYRVGDIISLDTGERGRVSFIGLRSTRLMTQDDVEVTIPNAVMGGAKIVNESGGPKRYERVKIPVGAAYGSDIDQVMEAIREVGAGLDQKHVCRNPPPRPRFVAFGASSLDFLLMVWVRDPAMRDEIASQALIDLYKRFDELDIEIPYAKRDLYIKEWPSPPAAD
jgi:MscS family membrane protein